MIVKTQLEYDNAYEKAKKTFYNYLVERKDRRQFTLCAKNFIERCYTIKDRARLQLQLYKFFKSDVLDRLDMAIRICCTYLRD